MKQQCGGTFLGLVLGLVVGLGMALAVAVYVTKVPIAFVNKVAGHSAEQDVEEAQKNKTWDPNAPLYGKNPAKPVLGTDPQVAVSKADGTTAHKVAEKGTEGKATPDVVHKETPKRATDPLGDWAMTNANKGSDAKSVEPFAYFVQLGAFRTTQEAENQRAKWSLDGIETKVSEREQSGRTVYRVRVGPYDNRADAEIVKSQLDAKGLETALVRVQR